MKYELNMAPAAEIATSQILRPAQVNELNAAAGVPAAPARLNLLARRNIRQARRDAR